MSTQLIDVKSISIGKDNARKVTKASVEELAKNIKAVGLLNPIIVRKKGKTKYDLIAGNRRLAAIKSLGEAKIRAEVVEADDMKAQAIRVTENLQRKNLEPFEEAQAIQILLDRGLNYEEAAAELGKTQQFVARRAQLLKLSKEWKDWLKENADLITVSALELVAKWNEDVQDEIFQEVSYIPDELITEYQIREFLSEYHQTLRSAPWDLNDDTLLPEAGACTNCPKRSGRQPELFHEDLTEKAVKRDEQCLDAGCYTKKLDAFIQKKYTELSAEHKNLKLISREGYYPGKIPGRTLPAPVLARFDYEETSKDFRGAIPVIIADGGAAGQLSWIKPERPATAGENSGKKIGPMTQEEKEIKLEIRRFVWIISQLDDHIRKLKSCKFFSGDDPFEVLNMLRFLLSYGTGAKDYLGYERWKAFANNNGETKKLRSMVIDQCRDGMLEYLTSIESQVKIWHEPVNKFEKDLNDFTDKLLGLDFGRYKVSAVETIKRPKSWPPFTKKSYQSIFPDKLEEEPPGKTKKKSGKKKAAGKNKTKKKKSLTPGICRKCGCTDSAPCVDDMGDPCYWVDETHTLCSACQDKGRKKRAKKKSKKKGKKS